MSDPYGDPIPPRHGEDEHWRTEPWPVCPLCGRSVRSEILPRLSPEDPVRGPYRCDLHGDVSPEWVYPPEEEEE